MNRTIILIYFPDGSCGETQSLTVMKDGNIKTDENVFCPTSIKEIEIVIESDYSTYKKV